MVDVSQYSDLADTGGFSSKEQTPPEKEIFKSLYIAGQMRQNEQAGVTEQPGQLQIRGRSYNLNEVNFIITHIKPVLVNQVEQNNRTQLKCFSYQSGPRPFKGTSGKICGKNRQEREADEFCKTCRSHLIVAGVLTDDNGSPYLAETGEDEDQRPEFIFIRARGIKYKAVSDYIAKLSGMDLESFFSSDDEQTKQFEKQVVNHKRFVSKVTVGFENSSYGQKYAFSLQEGKQLEPETTQKILDLASKMKPQFDEKFDWSQRMTNQDMSSYDQSQPDRSGQTFEQPQDNQPQNNQSQNNDQKSSGNQTSNNSGGTTSFDDISF